LVARRSYGQLCPIAHALDLVGERWTLLVVRELVLGPKRFTDLEDGLPGIGTNILSARLKQLEQIGVLQRRRLAPPAASWVYELTERGRELADIVLRLGRWGIGSPTFADLDAPARAEWTILSLKARYNPDAASDAPTQIELRLGDDTFNLQHNVHQLTIERGTATDPDLVLALEPATFTALLRSELRPRDALANGVTILTGTTAAYERFLRLFT
jgi:DNA-binding HxlR family transcriptional regulator